MKKLLIILIILLSVIILLLASLGIFAYIVSKPFLDSKYSLDNQDTASVSTDKHPLLSESQEAMLEKVGIDPAKLPTEITPEMQTCFVDKLGQERVDEIIKGAAPGALDFFKAQSCLSK
ncbi:MAG: hypothetical protein AAB791_01400 [Patescibacteria group bacterium]